MKPIKKEKEKNEYSVFGTNEFRNAHTGEVQKTVTIDWSQTGAVSFLDTKIPEEDILWHNYLSKFPEYVVIDFLSKEEFGDNPDLISVYYKKDAMCPKAKLASLPISTLDKLYERFNR